MPLELANIGALLSNLQTQFLGKYSTLKFIGVDKDDPKKPRVYLGEFTSNFEYQKVRNGEFLFFSSSSEEEYDIAKECTGVELVKSDGSFRRFAFQNQTKEEPSPPLYRWKFSLRENTQDVSVI